MRDDYRWILQQAGEHPGFTDNAEDYLRGILLEAEGRAEDIPTEMKVREVLLPSPLDELPGDQREVIRAIVRERLEKERQRYERAMLAVLGGKLEKAINILVKYEGPECKFIELEDDSGAGLSMGQHTQDPKHPELTRIRITAANIINMENMS